MSEAENKDRYSNDKDSNGSMSNNDSHDDEISNSNSNNSLGSNKSKTLPSQIGVSSKKGSVYSRSYLMSTIQEDEALFEQNDENTVETTQTAWDKIISTLNQTGNIALASSLKLLQLTFKTMVLPPIKLTKNFILPQLLQKVIHNTLDDTVSQRIQDWTTIVILFLERLLGTLLDEENSDSAKFRRAIKNISTSLLECVSSDVSRQCLVDSCALWIKYLDLLQTLEFQILLDQWSVLLVRIIEFLSSSSFQKLLHDSFELSVSSMKLSAHPTSLAAFAETTASICHALEMECYFYKRTKTTVTDAEQKRNKSLRRKERAKMREKTGSRSTFSKEEHYPGSEDVDVISDVIMSAVGDGLEDSTTTKQEKFNDKLLNYETDNDALHENNEAKNPIPQHVNFESTSDIHSNDIEDNISTILPSVTTNHDNMDSSKASIFLNEYDIPSYEPFFQQRTQNIHKRKLDTTHLGDLDYKTLFYNKQFDKERINRRKKTLEFYNNKYNTRQNTWYSKSCTTNPSKNEYGQDSLLSFAKSFVFSSSSSSDSITIPKKYLFFICLSIIIVFFSSLFSCIGIYYIYITYLHHGNILFSNNTPQPQTSPYSQELISILKALQQEQQLLKQTVPKEVVVRVIYEKADDSLHDSVQKDFNDISNDFVINNIDHIAHDIISNDHVIKSVHLETEGQKKENTFHNSLHNDQYGL